LIAWNTEIGTALPVFGASNGIHKFCIGVKHSSLLVLKAEREVRSEGDFLLDGWAV
jgi:hypothetical protein